MPGPMRIQEGSFTQGAHDSPVPWSFIEWLLHTKHGSGGGTEGEGTMELGGWRDQDKCAVIPAPNRVIYS